jgi:hypothetical protein
MQLSNRQLVFVVCPRREFPLPIQKMYFSANCRILGFTLVEVICPKFPAAKLGRA